MEITTELLNSIEGRPEWLGQWQLRRSKDATGEWEAVFEIEESSKEKLLAARIWIDDGNNVFIRSEVQTSRSNLELALYARRVELEVERRMNPVAFRELTKHEILQGMVATHDRFETELSRLAKTKPVLEGDFTKGEFPSDDVDTILARVSYSVKWLHWSRLGASWWDVWSDRGRYKLLGPWRLENPGKDPI